MDLPPPPHRAYIILNDDGDDDDANGKRRSAKLASIQRTLGETKQVLGTALSGLATRGEHLKKLFDLTSTLAHSANIFRTRSVQLNEDFFCLRLKLFLCCSLYAFVTLVALSYLTTPPTPTPTPPETWTTTLAATEAIQ